MALTVIVVELVWVLVWRVLKDRRPVLYVCEVLNEPKMGLKLGLRKGMIVEVSDKYVLDAHCES